MLCRLSTGRIVLAILAYPTTTQLDTFGLGWAAEHDPAGERSGFNGAIHSNGGLPRLRERTRRPGARALTIGRSGGGGGLASERDKASM